MNKNKIGDNLLSASMIMGVASFAMMVLGLVKNKFVAILLGPIGYGQISLVQNLLTVLSTICSLGTHNSAPRQLAKNLHNKESANRSVWTSLLIFIVLSIASIAVSGLVSINIFNFQVFDVLKGSERQFAFGVALIILSGGVICIINSVGKIKEGAIVNVIGTFIGAVVGVLVISVDGIEGIYYYLIATPFIILCFGFAYIKIELSGKFAINRQEIKDTIVLGFSYLGAATVAILTQLVLRMIVGEKIGDENLGYVSAALAISGSYMAVIVSSVGSNFFPKLSIVIEDNKKAIELIKNQIEVCFSMGLWLLVVCISIPSIIISILFSSSFDQAAGLIQYLAIADCLKIISWILGYVALSKFRGRAYLAFEIVGSGIFLLIVYFLIDKYGIDAVGLGAVFRYLAIFLISYLYCMKEVNFRFNVVEWMKIGAMLTLMIAIMIGVKYEYKIVQYLGLTLSALFLSIFLKRFYPIIIARVKRSD